MKKITLVLCTLSLCTFFVACSDKVYEEIRKEEVAATGKEKKLQAILNVKNDIIRKVADEYGVVPVKRRKRGKSK